MAPLLLLLLAVSPERQSITVGDRHVLVTFERGPFAASAAGRHAWAEAALRAVTAYFGVFPIDGAEVRILGTPGKGLQGHSAIVPKLGAQVTVELGREVTEASLRQDWVLVHELVHLGFPAVEASHHWVEEGLATYVEPLARFQQRRSGFGLEERGVWGQLADGLPRGLAAAVDGLDQTTSWAATYWGGALFWLLVDLDVREKSRGRCSVQDALRAFARSGITLATAKPLSEVLTLADRSVGSDSFSRIYGELGPKQTPPKLTPTDLTELLARLGVASVSGVLMLDNSALQAGLRQAVTAPDPGLCDAKL